MQRGSKLFTFWATVLGLAGVAIDVSTRCHVFAFVPYVKMVPKLFQATGLLLFVLAFASSFTSQNFVAKKAHSQ